MTAIDSPHHPWAKHIEAEFQKLKAEGSSSDTILASLNSACDTPPTIPTELAIDNGKDYRDGMPGRIAISRPCVIDGTFYCVCGASNHRGPIVHEGGLRRFYACETCGRVQPIYPDSIFPAATPESSTSTASNQAAPLATDGGGADNGLSDDARHDAAAAVRDSFADTNEAMARALANAYTAQSLLKIESRTAGDDTDAARRMFYLAEELGRAARELKASLAILVERRPFRTQTGRA